MHVVESISRDVCNVNVMSAMTSQSLSQSANVASLKDPKWIVVNEELPTMLSPLHFELCNDVISPNVAMVEFVSLVRAHLESHGLIKTNKPHTDKDHHRECSIVKLTERLTKVKNACRKYFSSSPREFLCSVKAHNKVKLAKDKYLNNRSARKQEKGFKQNP